MSESDTLTLTVPSEARMVLVWEMREVVVDGYVVRQDICQTSRAAPQARLLCGRCRDRRTLLSLTNLACVDISLCTLVSNVYSQ